MFPGGQVVAVYLATLLDSVFRQRIRPNYYRNVLRGYIGNICNDEALTYVKHTLQQNNISYVRISDSICMRMLVIYLYVIYNVLLFELYKVLLQK